MLTEGEKLRAQRLQIGGSSYAAIGKAIGYPAATVREAIRAPGTLPRGRHHRQDVEDLKALKIGRAAAGITNGHNNMAPDHVLADRDRRLAIEPQSVTAALMGDPPPGRSAWDKRQLRLVSSR